MLLERVGSVEARSIVNQLQERGGGLSTHALTIGGRRATPPLVDAVVEELDGLLVRQGSILRLGSGAQDLRIVCGGRSHQDGTW